MYWKITHHKENLTTKKNREEKKRYKAEKGLVPDKIQRCFILRSQISCKGWRVHTCSGHHSEVISARRLHNSFADHFPTDDTRSRSGFEVSYPQLTEFVGSHCY